MNKLNVTIASLVITFLGLFPAAALADDELDVTMEVLDSVADIDGDVIVMRGPDGEDGISDDGEFDGESDGEADGRDSDERESDETEGDDEISDEEVNAFFEEEAAREDEFEGDRNFQSEDDNENLGNVDDFEEGEDIDSEEFQEEEMNDDMEDDDSGDDVTELDNVAESDEVPSDGDAV